MTPDQLAKSGTEHAHQRALFAWANMAKRYGIGVAELDKSYTDKGYAHITLQNLHYPIPQLKWLHAIHNQGHGDAIRGSKAKAEGVKAGILDINLPISATVDTGKTDVELNRIWKTYHSFYIEMKVGNNKPTAEQLEFIEYCKANNIAHAVCYSWQEARDAILKYLGLI